MAKIHCAGFWALYFLLLFAMWLITSHARAQDPDVIMPFNGYAVKMTWPPGTVYETCETLGIQQQIVATNITQAEATNGAVLTVPTLTVRCRACNAQGCSELSPNALQIVRCRRPDANCNGVVNVSDIVSVNACIYRPTAPECQ